MFPPWLVVAVVVVLLLDSLSKTWGGPMAVRKMSGSVERLNDVVPGMDTINCILTGQGSCSFSVAMNAVVMVNGHIVSPGLLVPWIMRATRPVDVTLYPDEAKGGVSYRTEFSGDPL